MSRAIALALSVPLAAGCSHVLVAGEGPPPPVKHTPANGQDLAFVEQGEGVPVVFVHPSGGDWRSSDVLRPTIAARYRYVAYSRRYHHPNAWAGDGSDYSDETHVADLVVFAQGLGAGPVHLVGSGSGAAIVLRAVLQHPEIARSAVLDEPSTLSIIEGLPEATSVVADAAASLRARQVAARAGDDRQAGDLLLDWLSGESGTFEGLPPDERQVWNDNLPTVHAAILAARSPPVRCIDVSRVRVPVLVVRGERTTPFFRLVSDTLAGCLPAGTARELVPGAGHWTLLREPAAFARILLPFLARH
jgi:pimeloyl-ACP methyl ester carboxylesterase